MSKILQLQLLHDFSCSHCIGQILLVGQNQQHSILHLLLLQHLVQLFIGILDSVTVRTVHHVDQTICALKVVAPKSADLVLASHIPHVELDVLVLNSLNIESNCRNGGDYFSQLQSVEDGGLAGRIETKHQNPHLFGSNHPCPNLAKEHAHGSTSS
eukprot:Skav201276  [mRNA]  locus=scaffold2058:154559:155204:- [translate_table: standard]